MIARTLSLLSLVLLLGLSSQVLTGCGSIKKLTGQRNDTVLPGQREEILSPEQTRARNPEDLQSDGAPPAGGVVSTPCDPAQQNCPATIDQESGGFEG
jgi:hypothetical protein